MAAIANSEPRKTRFHHLSLSTAILEVFGPRVPVGFLHCAILNEKKAKHKGRIEKLSI